MPSFDIVSEVDMHEVANAIDQTNRELDTRFDFKGSGARVESTGAILSLQAGIDQDSARKIIKLIKESKTKVQSSIQGDKVRVSGKKRDDLQDVIHMLREARTGLPLQYINFRD
jgi:uncharacterized protein YajQ (UPF0234 family)